MLLMISFYTEIDQAKKYLFVNFYSSIQQISPLKIEQRYSNGGDITETFTINIKIR